MNDVRYRVIRIIIVLCFLLVATFLRNNVAQSYESASGIVSDITNTLKVEDLSDNYNDNSYVLRITNYGSSDKSFTIALKEDVNNTISCEDINYSVIKDDKVIISDSLSENGYLSYESLCADESSVYKIKFWFDDDVIDGVFSSRIVLI